MWPAARPASNAVDLRLLDAEPTDATSARRSTRSSARPCPAGPARDAVENGHSAHGGHAARAQRHHLLPTLHAVQESAGWISPGALNYVARRLTIPPAEVYGVASSTHCSRHPARAARAARVQRHGLPVRRLGQVDRSARATGRAARNRRGRRHLGAEPMPRAVRPRAGRVPRRVGREPRRARAGARRRRGTDRDSARRDTPRHRGPRRRPSWASRACGYCAESASSIPESLDDYRAHGGYAALRRAFASARRASSARCSTPS